MAAIAQTFIAFPSPLSLQFPPPDFLMAMPAVGFLLGPALSRQTFATLEVTSGCVTCSRCAMIFAEKLKFNSDGLIPAIIQEKSSGRVLMMAWMNRASLEKTVETGKTHFWSRSRQKFWMKGESSGHVQLVQEIAFDCDGDTLLIQVEQSGAACHEGYHSCFFRATRDNDQFIITEERLIAPEDVYRKS
jgi:phosphoribosyl-AMP cyclohydrolase